MKLKIVLILTLMLSGVIFAASCNRIANVIDSANASISATGEETTDESNTNNTEEEADETQNTEEYNTYAEIELAYKLGDWEVTVNSIEFADEVRDNQFLSFDPGEGNLFMVINVSVTNKWKKTDSFQKSLGNGKYVDVKLIYDGEYEYEPVNLPSYSNSFEDESIPALSSKTGDIIIKLPEFIRNEKEKAEIIFSYAKDKIVYDLP